MGFINYNTCVRGHNSTLTVTSRFALDGEISEKKMMICDKDIR